MDHKEIIEKFKNIDLSTYPVDEVKSLFETFGMFGVITTSLGPGKKIIRARENKSFTERFNTTSSLSYRPTPTVHYGRASSPGHTMFYGSIVPEIFGKLEPTTARFTALYEISEFARDKYSKGIRKLTFSLWKVKSNIELVSLIHFDDFKRPTRLSIELRELYKHLISKYPSLQKKSEDYTKFISEEFAKNNIIGDYDYLISALFTEKVCANGCNGILYPSVPLAGEGVNIAIRSDIVDSNLELNGAIECTLYKNGINAVIGNDREAEIFTTARLEYKKINNEFHLSRKKGKNMVELSYFNFIISYLMNLI